MKAIITLFISFLLTATSIACDCANKEKVIWDYLFKSDKVFVGTIKKIDTLDVNRILHFQVSTSYKNADEQIIKVITGFGGPDCGLSEVKVGDVWLIFAFTKNHLVFTNRCTNSCKSGTEKHDKKRSELDQFLSNKSGTYKAQGGFYSEATGTNVSNGAVGKWTITGGKTPGIKTQYYSNDSNLDSMFWYIDTVLIEEVRRQEKGIFTHVYNNEKQLQREIIEYDTIVGTDIHSIVENHSYFENGNKKEWSKYTSVHDSVQYNIRYSFYTFAEYYESGVLKKMIKEDKTGKRRVKTYNKKGVLKSEWTE